MWLMVLLSWISLLVCFLFAVLSVGRTLLPPSGSSAHGCWCVSSAAGLYYLAELVEEYSTAAGRVIRHMIMVREIIAMIPAVAPQLSPLLEQFCLVVYLLLLLLEDLPLAMTLCGLVSHGIHLVILKNFPFFDYSSVPFITGVGQSLELLLLL